ncbi:ectonucleoside triphosphate diphosphohydrolase 3-like [Acipenser oxyrinchus oxyrinchus]|uniref:Ectonucleoside triphosphate diphosphohydrolase 3-like n=1 Tax=Acipenser oxyrinchus oxyrinchus TaxID=40147 RepID=A0AAD8GFB6_ACIOX|nr:ectonucleoside triphosphate diphosphohydrolase 3-like [Acipenser oxyrinchus oxyrinchus]
MVSKLAAAIAFFFLLASLAVIITVAVIQIHKKSYVSPGLKYGIVLDAGSSRTTVYVYQWPAEKENNTGVVNQTLRCDVQGPGISSFGLDTKQDEKTWNSFNDCMNKTKSIIPTVQYNATPTYLGATAGMRLLRSKNETAASSILSTMKQYLQSWPFDFKGVSIITGQEEGIYGWITANYLMGNFVEKNLWNSWVRPHRAETTGSLDLGGASTQIAFSPEQDSKPNSTIAVVMYGYEYQVYTHSFQCYGRDEAEKRLLAALVQRSSGKSYAENPCYPQYYNTTMNAKYIFGSQCTAAQRPADYNPNQRLTILGTGDPALCRKEVLSIFNFTACPGEQNCSFDGVYQPDITGKFVAYSGFYYTTVALNLMGSFQLDNFNSSTWSFCSLEWPKLQEMHSSVKKIYLKSYCFSANYIYSLLVNGYKFNAQSWMQISFQREVDNSSISWSLGYMLNLTNMIPAEADLVKLPMTSSVFAGLLFMFSMLAILSLMFLVISVVRSC